MLDQSETNDCRRAAGSDGSTALVRDFLRRAAAPSPEHLKVIARLEKATNRDWTIADALRVQPEEIQRHKGVGSTYARYFAELQELLKAYLRGKRGKENCPGNAPQILEWLHRGGYELNWVGLSLSERRVLRKLEYRLERKRTLPRW